MCKIEAMKRLTGQVSEKLLRLKPIYMDLTKIVLKYFLLESVC